MAINTITEKIVSDAVAYADGLISEAKKEAENIAGKALEEADLIKRQMAAQASKDVVIIAHRKQSDSELEARKMRLAVKQKVVTKALEAAIDKLADMEQEAYIAFLTQKIAETGIKDGQLLLNAKDKEDLGEKLAAAANKELKGGKITLSDQTIDAKGGFVLKCDALEINSTIEAMIDSIKDSVTPKVAAVLFQE